MRQLSLLALCGLASWFVACNVPSSESPGGTENEAAPEAAYDPAADVLRYDGEVRLRNVRQLTFGGNNAEAYWSLDDQQLIFQSDWSQINDQGCDQIYLMNADGSPLGASPSTSFTVSAAPEDGLERYGLISTGKGRTTCGYWLTDRRAVYASTHAAASECPETVSFAQGRYVWPIYDTYDIYLGSGDSGPPELLIGSPGYDAEATASPDGRYLVFTSTRSGDLELWRYELATGELLQLTSDLGYDGGAFFSRDSTQIVWRASRPQGEDATAYKDLLAQGLVEPSALTVFVANADGSEARAVTQLAGANWAPFFHPDGKRILFVSNHHTLEQGGRLFDIFLIGLDGSGLEQVTHSGTFDAFPMFSYDGGRLVFASNRNRDDPESRDTNIFVADWVEEP